MPKRLCIEDQVVEKLIEEIREQPSLWNLNDYRYGKVSHFQFWRHMAQKYNVSDKLLRTKWKNLRDMFFKEHKKMGSSNLAMYKGKWRYYSNLYFLLDGQISATNTNRKEQSVLIRVTDTLEENIDKSDATSEEMLIEMTEIDKSNIKNALSDHENIVVSNITKVQEIEMPLSVDDEYDLMFLKSLLPYFQRLESNRRLSVRCKLQQLLLNEITMQNGVDSNEE